MLSVLTNIRSTKMFWWDGYHYLEGHHLITTFSNIHEFDSKKFLPKKNLALECH